MIIINDIENIEDPVQITGIVDKQHEFTHNQYYWMTDELAATKTFDLNFHMYWNTDYECMSINAKKHFEEPCIFTFYVYHDHDKELHIKYKTFIMFELSNTFHIPHTLKNMNYTIFVTCTVHGRTIKNHDLIGSYQF
tara:strand:+ start:165 stop:575 length:411 start_codon:yes stop_codon:yes gene_type:complete